MTPARLQATLLLSVSLTCRPVPHSLYDYDGAELCLIVKDRQGTLPAPLHAGLSVECGLTQAEYQSAQCILEV